jgi:TPR repeat protein
VNLGVHYALGQGVPQDYAEAYFWISVSLAGNLGEGEKKQAEMGREEVAAHLSSAKLTEAQARATLWLEQNIK